VRMRRLLCAGRRSWSRICSSARVVVAGRGRERVAGRLRPGKEVKRTLTVAIMRNFRDFWLVVEM